MTLTPITDVLTEEQIEMIENSIVTAVDVLIKQAGYMGMFGSGDYQKVEHVLASIPAYDFEFEHVYGTLFGLLSALSLGDADEVGYRAESIATDILNYVEMQEELA